MNEAPAKPLTLNGDLANLPIALRELADKTIWVVWNWELRKGLWTKPPRRPNGQLAESNNPKTWSTYEEVLAVAERHDGIGVMLRDLEIAAADLDKCRDPITGEIEPWAQDIIARLPAAYTEISVSGTGMRMIAQGAGGSVQRRFHINGANGTKGPALELFRRCARFITVSCNEIGHCDELPNGDALIDTLLFEYDGQRQEKQPRQEESTANGFDWRKEQFLLPEKLLNLIWKGVAPPQRSEQFHHVVAWLKQLGWQADDICSILASHPDGIAAKYGNRLRDEVNRSFTKCREAEQSASAQSQTWAPPVDLWAKFDAPELLSGVLPPIIERFARDQAAVMGADPAGIAMAALTICAAAIPDRIKLQAKVHYHGWTEAARIWTALIGPPSTKKSPILREAAWPLTRLDARMFKAYAEEKKKYDALPADERKTTPPPKHVRVRLEDTTIEAARRCCAIVLMDCSACKTNFQAGSAAWTNMQPDAAQPKIAASGFNRSMAGRMPSIASAAARI